MARILSVMLFNVLGLLLLQGKWRLLVTLFGNYKDFSLSKSARQLPLFSFLFFSFLEGLGGIMPLMTYNCLFIFSFSLFFWQSKVLLVLCSQLSSTREVSRALAGNLAPGDPRVLRCQGPQRQSPGPSAAPAIPTRTKSASTTATWISSGSTLLSKIYFYLVCGCPVTHASSDLRSTVACAWFAGSGGQGNNIVTDIWPPRAKEGGVVQWSQCIVEWVTPWRYGQPSRFKWRQAQQKVVGDAR